YPFVDLLVFGGIYLGQERDADNLIRQAIIRDQFAGADMAAEKDAAQGIVVFRRDWVILVIVATGAGEGQTQELTANYIDLTVHDSGNGEVPADSFPGGKGQHAGGDHAIE